MSSLSVIQVLSGVCVIVDRRCVFTFLGTENGRSLVVFVAGKVLNTLQYIKMQDRIQNNFILQFVVICSTFTYAQSFIIPLPLPLPRVR